MKLNEIVAPTMKALFVSEIERLILSGQLKIGEQLPTERAMSEQMKISRTITNAGINELARKGFVEIVPRQGTFVADYKRNGTLDTLLAIIQFNGGRFDHATFRSLMELHILIEGACTFAAAEHRTEQDIVDLQACYAKILASQNAQDAARLKLEFFHTVACASGNVIYPLVVNAFREISIVFDEILFQHVGAERASQSLEQLIAAIREQKPVLAQAITLALISEQVQTLEEKYFDSQDGR